MAMALALDHFLEALKELLENIEVQVLPHHEILI